jgi:hypothetical protein
MPGPRARDKRIAARPARPWIVMQFLGGTPSPKSKILGYKGRKADETWQPSSGEPIIPKFAAETAKAIAVRAWIKVCARLAPSIPKGRSACAVREAHP